LRVPKTERLTPALASAALPREQGRATLAERLRQRREEIEQAALTRIYDVSPPGDRLDPEYIIGLKAATAAALDYAFATVEDGERCSPSVPVALLGQARLAARNGVGIETVMRRYFSGFALFGEFVFQEFGPDIAAAGVSPQRLWQVQVEQFDRLIAAVVEEYEREQKARPASKQQRRLDRIERLLGGESLGAEELGYDFAVWHVAVVASGPDRQHELQRVAQDLDRRLLAVTPKQGKVWAWFGGQRKLPAKQLAERMRSIWPRDFPVYLGEPAKGLPGWRLSHRQAKALNGIGRDPADSIVCYAESGLLASVLKDDLLVSSLDQLYLAPLAEERDGGEAFRETLRAYLSAGRNVTSAAAALGVTRQTVATRLRAIEERIGRRLDECAAEIEISLRLESVPVDPPKSTEHDLTL
jgi:hypothetical protein